MNCFDESSLDEVEGELGISLPGAYRDFLVSLDSEEVAKNNESFFSFCLLGSAAALIRENQLVHFDDIPGCDLDEPFVIANDGCGNVWVIDADDEDSAVYFAEHDPQGFSERAPSLADLPSLIAQDAVAAEKFRS